MKIETRESTQAKVAERLGLNQPSAMDLVDRAKYATDTEYLTAVAQMETQLSDPAFQAARRRVAAEIRERDEQELLKKREAAYAGIRQSVQLDTVDTREIDAAAVQLARRDLAAQRIAPSDMGATIERYANELTQQRKNERASNQLFNDMLRGKL